MPTQTEQLQKKVLVVPASVRFERVRRLADDLASIPNVQVWIERSNDLQIGMIPPIFQGIGSDLVTYSNGWLHFRKPNVVNYLSETVSLTIFYFPRQAKEVEQILQQILPSLPVGTQEK